MSVHSRIRVGVVNSSLRLHCMSDFVSGLAKTCLCDALHAHALREERARALTARARGEGRPAKGSAWKAHATERTGMIRKTLPRHVMTHRKHRGNVLRDMNRAASIAESARKTEAECCTGLWRSAHARGQECSRGHVHGEEETQAGTEKQSQTAHVPKNPAQGRLRGHGCQGQFQGIGALKERR